MCYNICTTHQTPVVSVLFLQRVGFRVVVANPTVASVLEVFNHSSSVKVRGNSFVLNNPSNLPIGKNTQEGSAGTSCTALATNKATSHLVAQRVAELISASIIGDTEINL